MLWTGKEGSIGKCWMEIPLHLTVMFGDSQMHPEKWCNICYVYLFLNCVSNSDCILYWRALLKVNVDFIKTNIKVFVGGQYIWTMNWINGSNLTQRCWNLDHGTASEGNPLIKCGFTTHWKIQMAIIYKDFIHLYSCLANY